MVHKGLALYGLPMMDTSMVARVLPCGCSLSLLAGTFGKPLPILETLLKKTKLPVVEVHIGNGSCIRMKRCEKGEPTYTSYDVLKVRAHAVDLLAQKYPDTEFIISPFVEYNLQDPRIVNNWINLIKTSAPRCKIVVSAIDNGYIPKNVLIERHGNHPGHTNIISNDGESCFDAPSNWESNANTAAFFWDYSCNGRVKGDDGTTPPSKRPKSSFTNEDTLKKMLHLAGF